DTWFCAKCDIAVQVPRPSPEEIGKIYDEEYYRSWGEHDSDHAYWGLKKKFFNRILDIAAPVAEGSLALDIGCATGAGLSVFAERGWMPYGTDVNSLAVTVARRRVPEAEVIEGELGDLSGEEGRFSLILMSDVIEHYLDPWAVMSDVRRHLAPEGEVVIVTPDIGAVSARLLGQRWPHYKREHVVLFSRKSLRALLLDTGFSPTVMRSAPKALSLSYTTLQFQSYPMPVVTTLTRMVSR
ncbi:MAG TPA: hypothetical protein DIT99_18275, partial [Candidatus Latescibacteria bacterium]|nr:hypothetical protein [Candidatus Latescibacterota bacterium]